MYICAFEEVSLWQNAVFAERALFLVRQYLTPTARPTEPGSPTFVRSRLWLTVPPRRLPFAPVACVPARSAERKCFARKGSLPLLLIKPNKKGRIISVLFYFSLQKQILRRVVLAAISRYRLATADASSDSRQRMPTFIPLSIHVRAASISG